MKKFSFIERLKNIQQMQTDLFDLVIIGGGITGAGAARDAAARGMKVALIETHDFASGTSSRSSKLIHGGIRYLENMEFKLVFEALNERNRLFQMAPHLVHHLRFMIPLYQNSRVGMTKMGLGMWLYDALALFQAPELHERLNASQSMHRMPCLRGDQLKGSYIYSDGYMDDDRLVFETLRSAAQHGAICANEVSATGAIFDAAGRITHVSAKDRLTGKDFRIQARHVISSVGPWTDELGEDLFKDWKKILRPTKGVHITLAKDRLPLTSAVVMAAEKSDRIVFAIPRHEMIIIGTTDTDHKNTPEGVIADRADIEYLLSVTEQYFPGAQIRESDIISSYAGVRPLVQDGSSSEGKTSREHVIFNDPRGVTFVAGGKYTTYRLMAQQVVDSALKTFSVEDRIRFKPTDTTLPLNEWTSPEAYHQAFLAVAELVGSTGRSNAEVRHFVERYGREAEEILPRYNGQWNMWQVEAAQAIDTTMCLNLTDFFARRVHLFLMDPRHGLQMMDDVAEVFQHLLRWTDVQTQAQKADFKAYIARELGWKTAP